MPKKISIKDKYEIICKIKSGVKRDLTLDQYQLKSYANITRIMKNKKQIVERFESNDRKSAKNQFRLSEAKYPELEKALIIWIRKVRTNKIPINREMILAKAEKFAKDLGIDFKPTHGHLKGLKT